MTDAIQGRSPDRQALVRLARSVGIRSPRLSQNELPKMPREKGLISEARHDLGVPFLAEKPAFLLIDDQFDLGYTEILSVLMFGPRRDWTVTSTGTAGSLQIETTVGTLHSLKESGKLITTLAESGRPSTEPFDWRAPRLLQWEEQQLAGVFLDLRLWTEPIQQKAVLSEIVVKARELQIERTGDEAVSHALVAAEAVIAGERDQVEALALLPLLLSHYDPSLPIVIFSSTHQRQVVRLVAHRHNIITTFSKPLLTGSGSSGDDVASLIEAIRRALALQSSRHLWERIVNSHVLTHPSVKWSVGDESQVRAALAGFVWHYLITDRSYDFLSVPYEYLEAEVGRNCPILRSYAGTDDMERRKEAMRDWNAGGKHLLDGIRFIRNRKVHGAAWTLPVSDRMLDQAAHILCAAFLDFLMSVTSPISLRAIEDEPHRLSRADLGRRLSARIGITPAGKLRWPPDVADHPQLQWSNYIAVVFLFWLNKIGEMDEATARACWQFVERWANSSSS